MATPTAAHPTDAEAGNPHDRAVLPRLPLLPRTATGKDDVPATRYEICPVCKRPVAVSKHRAIVFAHHDKTHQPCPMSGQPMGDTT
jgi:hypothetical protein